MAAQRDKYGFSTLEIGKAFDVDMSKVTYDNLHRIRQHWGRKLDANFKIRTFGDEGVYEVSRLEGGYAGRVSSPVKAPRERKEPHRRTSKDYYDEVTKAMKRLNSEDPA